MPLVQRGPMPPHLSTLSSQDTMVGTLQHYLKVEVLGTNFPLIGECEWVSRVACSMLPQGSSTIFVILSITPQATNDHRIVMAPNKGTIVHKATKRSRTKLWRVS